MSTQKIYEPVLVDGVELFRTYRGYQNEIEVYTCQAGNRTYSLYHKPDEAGWRCDWTTSYNCQPIELGAQPTDKEAMLKAFAALLKSLSTSAH